MIGLVGALAAPLRRLHRPRRHRADVPRLRRAGLQAGRAGAAQAGPAGHGRRLHGAPRRAARHQRRAEADDHRPRDRVRRTARCSASCSRRAGSSTSTRSEPTTEVAIRRAAGEDLYVVLAAYDVETQTATYAVTINPLVNWIWFGFGVLALGTGLALLPETAFAFAAAKLPAGRGDDDAAGAADAAAGRVAPRADERDRPGGAAQRARAAARRRDHLHLRLPALAGQLRHAELRGARRADGEDAAVPEGRQGPRQHHRRLHPGVRRRRTSCPRRSTRASTAWRGSFPYLVGASGAAMVGFAAVKLVAPAERRAAASRTVGAARRGRRCRRKLDDELRDLD